MKPWLSVFRALGLILILLAAPLRAQEMPEGDVRVGPGDVFKLKIYGQPDLSDLYEIAPDGTLTIPGLGRIENVQRLSEARKGIGALVDANLGLPETHFSVTIARMRPVTVGGDVGNPGEVPYKLGLRVAQAIALAGGARRNLSSDQLGRLIQVNQEQERLAHAKLRLARALMTEARLSAETRRKTDFEIPAEVLELVSEEQAARLKANEVSIAQTNASIHEIAEKRITAAAEINVNDIRAQRLSRNSLQSQLDLVRADLDRLAPLIDKQAITSDRILNLRLDVAQIEGFYGQAVAKLAKSETEGAVLAEERVALGLQRTLNITSQMVATEAEIMEATASIKAISATLDRARDLPFMSDIGKLDKRPGRCEIAILRTDETGSPQIMPADALSVLDPGDHVEVGPVARDCPSLFFQMDTE